MLFEEALCYSTASSKVSALKACIDWHQDEVVTVSGHWQSTWVRVEGV